METKIRTIEILKDYHKITRARISLHDLYFKEIAAYPESPSYFCGKIQQNKTAKQLCFECDQKAFNYAKHKGKVYTYKCHCGLLETVAPIYNYGTLTGYFMMGQICQDNPQNILRIKELSKKYFKEKNELDYAIKKIPNVKEELLESNINILAILAEYITNTNRISLKDRDIAESAKNYIQKFFYKKISVNSLCEIFGCSRTTLINLFTKKHNISIGNFITQCRLENAENMLKKSNESIKNIAVSCGFSDQNYFVKVFRKKNNCTPTHYRKQNASAPLRWISEITPCSSKRRFSVGL